MFDINDLKYVNEFTAGDKFSGPLFVNSAELRTTKTGSFYWNITASDNSGVIEARMFDATGNEEVEASKIHWITGTVEQYNGSNQLRISSIRLCDTKKPEVLARLIPTCDVNVEKAWSYIVSAIDNWKINDLQKLATAVIEAVGTENYKTCAAGAKVHHSGRHGLLLHVYSMLLDAEGMIKAYPFANKEIIQCGIILHDVGKIAGEMEFNEHGLVSDYSIDGSLGSHLYIGARLVENIGKQIQIDDELLRQIVHIILSHHGKLEWGAIVLPKTLEAIIVSAIDMLDAQVNQIAEATKNVVAGTFTEKINTLDGRKIYVPICSET